MTHYEATPEQWAQCEGWAPIPFIGASDACILELRARVEALEAIKRPASKVYEISKPLQLTSEQAQHVRDLLTPNSKPTPNSSQIGSSLEAGAKRSVFELSDDDPIPQRPVRAGSLVERVSRAIDHSICPDQWLHLDAARAAIRVIAGELKAQCFVHASDWLEQEAKL